MWVILLYQCQKVSILKWTMTSDSLFCAAKFSTDLKSRQPSYCSLSNRKPIYCLKRLIQNGWKMTYRSVCTFPITNHWQCANPWVVTAGHRFSHTNHDLALRDSLALHNQLYTNLQLFSLFQELGTGFIHSWD